MNTAGTWKIGSERKANWENGDQTKSFTMSALRRPGADNPSVGLTGAPNGDLLHSSVISGVGFQDHSVQATGRRRLQLSGNAALN